MKKTWNDQFLESFNSSGSYRSLNDSNSSINSVASDEGSEFNTLIPTILDALALNKRDDDLYILQELICVCESPIEIAMAIALKMQRCYSPTYEIIFNVYGENLKLLKQFYPVRIVINPQVKIEKYRVDFLVDSSIIHYASGSHIKSSVVVECDGHDFHEKTKDQAKKDKQKDRHLQSLGHRVFRFTGSEIWSDVFKCAEEVIKFLTKSEIRC